MADKKRGLGKGLDDLGLHELLAGMGEPVALAERPPIDPEQDGLLHVPLNRLVPGTYQPRQQMDDDQLLELSQSIRAHGVIQPILVRRAASDAYEIVAGERRWRAAKLANLQSIPIIVQSMTDEMAAAVALIENIQRESLNVVDEAEGLRRLMQEFGLSHQALAQAVGKSRASVSNVLRLLEADPVVLAALKAGRLSMGHARALLSLTASQQIKVAEQIQQGQWSVRQTEQWVKRLLKGGRPNISLPDYSLQAKQLEQQFKAKVSIKSNVRGGGQIKVKFANAAELDNLMQLLAGEVS
jgi:ParB family chromosome partitioning protein